MSSTKEKLVFVLVGHIKAGTNLKDLSMLQIATEAEIGKSTVYEHFASKEEMISETYIYLLQTYEGILLEPVTMTDFKTAFIEQIKKISTVMSDAKVIMDAIMNNSFDLMPLLKKEHHALIESIQDKMSKRFEEIIKMAHAQGLIESNNTNPYAKHVMQAIISGILLQHVKNEINLDEVAIYNLIYESIIKILS